ncbi:MAG: hypothetical protein AAB307_00810, partial [Deltaproteobacteria bacterium]
MVERMLQYLGKKVIGQVLVLNSYRRAAVSSLGSFVFRFGRNRAAVMNVLFKQIYFTGFEAIPIISWIAVVLGLVIVTQSLSILPKVGGEG